MVKRILQVEGLFFFVASLFFYHNLEGNWLLFIILLFIPDISMIGYLKNKKLGSVIYNLGHTYIFAFIITICGFYLFRNSTLTMFGFILFAHVALDRFLGFGLKYPTSFRDTHIQKL